MKRPVFVYILLQCKVGAENKLLLPGMCDTW